MKPAPFEYLAARTCDEVIGALAAGEGETRVLAGGQSLLLEMNYRAVRPVQLVDINRVRDFGGLDVVTVPDSGPWLCVGPLVRHGRFEQQVEAGPLGRLLARAVHFIAHPPVRARGTMLGSLAYAHPTAEWPTLAVTLDARLDLVHEHGARTLSADDFITGSFATARRPDELLTRVCLPLLPTATGVAFVEHRRTAASFAQLAVAAALSAQDGVVADARIGLAGTAARPTRARAAEALLTGRAPTDEAINRAAAASVGVVDAPDDPHAGDSYRRHAAEVLVRRALMQARDDIAERT
ncbi:FAD binding domain-containing protein [Streptomyces brasiliensis]|uniref:Carbon monoxide dehydrogenase n=1 Tax=Streptomyces brasiliensis TaxID=1954 RepID=A0A917NFU7_9ACTN|nr:FAD binding domain-containing protein [Streptomyces brasiliensis]GGI93794.1 carbon monoxide dehydrogenase [Streptomyces brasiliensis]